MVEKWAQYYSTGSRLAVKRGKRSRRGSPKEWMRADLIWTALHWPLWLVGQRAGLTAPGSEKISKMDR